MSTTSQPSGIERGKVRTGVFYAAAFITVLFIFGGADTAFAAVTLTPATGGSAISADTTGGAFSALTGPVITENVATPSDISTGTIILNAPSGFNFDTTSNSVTATRATAGGSCGRSNSLLLNGAASQTVTPTATTITVTVSRATSSSCRTTITWTGIKVRPTAGTPLASGNIVKTGTSAISGITNGVTNIGMLTEVAGAASKLAFTTQPGSATYGSVLSVQPIVVSQDQFGNPSTNGLGASKTVTLTLTSGTGSLQGVTALDIGTGAGNGTVTFSDLSVSAAGTGKAITAAATGLTNAVSNAFTINVLQVVLSGTRAYDTTDVAAYGILSVSNKVGSDDVTVASGSGTLASADAGARAITSFGTLALGGTTAGNYTLTGGSGTVTITPASQTITFDALPDKVIGEPDFLVSATASSGLTVSFSSLTTGVCTVSTATVHLVSEGTCTIRASQAGNGNYAAAPNVDRSFAVTAPVLDHFAIAAIGPQVAGVPFDITITAQDASNGTIIGYAGTVDLTTTAGTIIPSQSSAFSSGVRIESVTVTGAGSGKIITATDHGGTKTGTSSGFSVAAGSVASFTLSDPGDMYAKTRLGYTVSRQDAYGNPATTATTTVYFYTSSSGGTAKFYDDSLGGTVVTSVEIGPDHSTANIWYYDETPGSYTITASDNASVPDGTTGVDDDSDTVTVMPVATKFVIVQPADGTVDAPTVVTVQALKPDDSIDTNYQNDVTLVTNGSAAGGGLVSIVNGVGMRNISDMVVETVTLSLSDSETTGLDVISTRQVSFGVGALAQFTLSHPAASAAGTRAAYTVTRADQYGNVRTTATTTVYLHSTSTGTHKKFYDAATEGNVITFINIPNGQSTASVWYYDELPGTWAIVGSDNASAPDYDAGINDAVDSHQVTAGPIASFALDNPGNMTAGTRLGYTVSRKDQFNNVVTDGSTLVRLSSDSTGTSTPLFYSTDTGGDPITSISIGNGQSSISFWYYDPNVGSWTVTASDSDPADGATGVIDATDLVTVNAAPIVATRFVISPPTDGTTDASITITVQAEDASGNIDTAYQNDVTLNATGSATGAGLVNIVNGVGTIALSDTLAQTVDLSLTDSQSTGLDASSTRSVTFAPGAVAQFSITNPGDIAAGLRIGYNVSRKDQHGNAVTSGVTTVYLYSTSTGANAKFYEAASGGSAITQSVIPGGSSSVGFWAYDEKAGDWYITVSDNASTPDGTSGIDDASDALTVEPAVAAKFLLDNPGNMTADTRLGYTVTREDQFDNLVTAGVTLAYLYSSSTGTTTAFYTTDTGGAPTLFATINDASSSGRFWYYDEMPGTWAVTASDSPTAPNGSTGLIDAVDSVTVTAVPIVATRFVILPPTGAETGTPVTVTVQAQDASGNIDTTYQQDVTLHATGSATGGGLVNIVNGIGTLTLSDAIAETVTLSLSDSQSTGLNVSSTQILTFSTAPIIPSGGAAVGAGIMVPTVAGVQISGRAFPGARIEILAVSPQGTTVAREATAESDGSFSALLTGTEAGANAYGVVGIDALLRATQTKVLYANYANTNELLTLDASLLSPTLGLIHPTVRRGDVVGAVGMAIPGYLVGVQIDGKTIASGTVDEDGAYKILVPTTGLALGSHTIRVRQVSPSGAQSEYAPQKVFTVTTLFTPQTDFNQDGVINVQDWSIFLSRWSSTVPSVRLLDDLNGDGKVDVTDLSIFVRTLKR